MCSKDTSISNLFLLNNPIDASASIYRKSFLKEIGGFSESLTTNIDWELLLRGSKVREIKMKKVDKVLTENWTMFDSLSENSELERKERRELLSQYASELFDVITESNKIIEEEYKVSYEHFLEKECQYKTLLARKDSFYQMMSKWMYIKLDGGSLADKLRQRGYCKIAIYGAGKHGRMLFKDLINNGTRVEYFIDREANSAEAIDVPILSMADTFPEVDVIVITPYLEFEEIKQNLEQKCKYNIMALNELIEG